MFLTDSSDVQVEGEMTRKVTGANSDILYRKGRPAKCRLWYQSAVMERNVYERSATQLSMSITGQDLHKEIGNCRLLFC